MYISEKAGGSGQIVWTNSMSTMMLSFLADLIASDTRTSTGFKRLHLNNCAKALNEHFKLAITADQVNNHLKKWRKTWLRIDKLKQLSGALWDDDTCTIRLDGDHYTGHIQEHKSDAPYLNSPIDNYHAMSTIYGAQVATGKYAKSGNDPLSVEVNDLVEEEAYESGAAAPTGASNEDINTSTNNCESSVVKPPRKRAKVAKKDDDLLLSTLERVALALEKAGGGDGEIPDGLWDDLAGLPFDEGSLSHYYAHLIDNPRTARAFATLSLPNKLIWMTRYIIKNNLD